MGDRGIPARMNLFELPHHVQVSILPIPDSLADPGFSPLPSSVRRVPTLYLPYPLHRRHTSAIRSFSFPLWRDSCKLRGFLSASGNSQSPLASEVVSLPGPEPLDPHRWGHRSPKQEPRNPFYEYISIDASNVVQKRIVSPFLPPETTHFLNLAPSSLLPLAVLGAFKVEVPTSKLDAGIITRFCSLDPSRSGF